MRLMNLMAAISMGAPSLIPLGAVLIVGTIAWWISVSMLGLGRILPDRRPGREEPRGNRNPQTGSSDDEPAA